MKLYFVQNRVPADTAAEKDRTAGRVAALALAMFMFAPWPAFGGQANADQHAGHKMDAMPDSSPPAEPHAGHKAEDRAGQSKNSSPTLLGRPRPAAPTQNVATPPFEEHLGRIVPEGIMLRDESGKLVDARSLMTVPAVVLPVFLSCTAGCATLQSSVAAALPQLGLAPGKDYIVITASFDEQDTPELAEHRKKNYLAAAGYTVQDDGWRYLTGDLESVKRFMDSIGFNYIRLGPGNFAHPLGLVVLAPGGKVVRYLYGQGVMPFDLNMALTEAAQGKTGLSIKRMLAYCFTYDPESRGYVFNVLRVVGAGVLLGMGLLLFALLRGGKRKPVKQQREPS